MGRWLSSGTLRRALLRDLFAFLARLGQPDRDGLFAAFHFTAFAAATAFCCPTFIAVHFALDVAPALFEYLRRLLAIVFLVKLSLISLSNST